MFIPERVSNGAISSRNFHTAKLRPHLDGHAEYNALEDAGFDKSSETGFGNLTLESKSLLNLLVFSENLGVVDIATTVEVGKHLKSLLPAVF